MAILVHRLLHLDGGFTGNDGYRLLLGVMRIHLENLQMRGTGAHRVHHKAENRPGSVHSGCVGLARRRDNDFTFLLVDSLYDRDLLRAPRKETAVADFLHAHHGGIVMNH